MLSDVLALGLDLGFGSSSGVGVILLMCWSYESQNEYTHVFTRTHTTRPTILDGFTRNLSRLLLLFLLGKLVTFLASLLQTILMRIQSPHKRVHPLVLSHLIPIKRAIFFAQFLLAFSQDL